MIKLRLAPGKYPAPISASVSEFVRRLPGLSRALSDIRGRALSGRRHNKRKITFIDIQVIPDRTMLKINTNFRKKKETTDVLSFSYLESGAPVFDHEPAGEILISYQKAAAQAKENKIQLPDELSVLAVHGTLHIIGYDHEISAKEEAAMKRAESRVLIAAGFALHVGALTARRGSVGRVSPLPAPVVGQRRSARTAEN